LNFIAYQRASSAAKGIDFLWEQIKGVKCGANKGLPGAAEEKACPLTPSVDGSLSHLQTEDVGPGLSVMALQLLS